MVMKLRETIGFSCKGGVAFSARIDAQADSSDLFLFAVRAHMASALPAFNVRYFDSDGFSIPNAEATCGTDFLCCHSECILSRGKKEWSGKSVMSRCSRGLFKACCWAWEKCPSNGVRYIFKERK